MPIEKAQDASSGGDFFENHTREMYDLSHEQYTAYRLVSDGIIARPQELHEQILADPDAVSENTAKWVKEHPDFVEHCFNEMDQDRI